MSLVKVNNKTYLQTEGVLSVFDTGYRTTFGYKQQVCVEYFNGKSVIIEDVTVSEVVKLVEDDDHV